MPEELKGKDLPEGPPTTYEKWQKSEGIRSIKANFIEDIYNLPLDPWERKGGKGIFMNLADQQADDAYVCEIPAGGSLKPQRHLFEELIYIVEGKELPLYGMKEARSRHLNGSRGVSFLHLSIAFISTSMAREINLAGIWLLPMPLP